jgi:hypothetical protein
MEKGRRLIDVLVFVFVISCIGVSAWIFLSPPKKTVFLENTQKAHEQATAILTAIRDFESSCDTLPWDCGGDLKFSEKNKADYDKLMETLTCVPGPGNDKADVGNPKKIKFLEPTEDYKEKGYLDPWGIRFNVYLDMDFDHKVTIGEKELTGNVFVYSSGPNKIDEEGGGDDICSWKE